jgi:2-phosphosulfolactate phosphatase
MNDRVKNKPTLHTCLSPALLHLYDVKDALVVVIDVFRATSTIASALYNGAEAVIPVDTVPRAIEIAAAVSGIAAGERDGRIAEGLQHGNSPMEYHRSFIEGKRLVLTTTNGTKLLYMALERGARDIVTGSFPNLGAVCGYLQEKQQNVVLACAGWKDRFNMEDTLFAGAVIDQIGQKFTSFCDSSATALHLYQNMKNDLMGHAKHFTHYHRLVERFGLIEDIRFCLTPDAANVLPFYTEGRLVI